MIDQEKESMSLFARLCHPACVRHVLPGSLWWLARSVGSVGSVGSVWLSWLSLAQLARSGSVGSLWLSLAQSGFPARASQTDKQNQIDYTFSVRLKTESTSLYIALQVIDTLYTVLARSLTWLTLPH